MAHPSRPVRPSVDELFETFSGRIYRPIVDGKLSLETWGWGGSSPDVTSFDLQFVVPSARKPRSRERIVVEIGGPSHRPYARPLFDLLGQVALEAPPSFPLVFDRSKHRIRVDGRERVFTLYTAASAAVAVARLGEFRLQIRCQRSRLTTLVLQTVAPDELRRMPAFRSATA
jgi:hypothetical protein